MLALKESIFAERVQNRCEGIDRVLNGDCSGSDDVVAVAGVHASDGGLHLVLHMSSSLFNKYFIFHDTFLISRKKTYIGRTSLLFHSERFERLSNNASLRLIKNVSN